MLWSLSLDTKFLKKQEIWDRIIAESVIEEAIKKQKKYNDCISKIFIPFSLKEKKRAKKCQNTYMYNRKKAETKSWKCLSWSVVCRSYHNTSRLIEQFLTTYYYKVER